MVGSGYGDKGYIEEEGSKRFVEYAASTYGHGTEGVAMIGIVEGNDLGTRCA